MNIGIVECVDLPVIREQHLVIRTSPSYTTLVLNGIDFHFNRDSGEYDGWSEPSFPSCCRDCEEGKEIDLLGTIRDCPRTALQKIIDELKHSDGEHWAVGELLTRACLSLDVEENN